MGAGGARASCTADWASCGTFTASITAPSARHCAMEECYDLVKDLDFAFGTVMGPRGLGLPSIKESLRKSNMALCKLGFRFPTMQFVIFAMGCSRPSRTGERFTHSGEQPVASVD